MVGISEKVVSQAHPLIQKIFTEHPYVSIYMLVTSGSNSEEKTDLDKA